MKTYACIALMGAFAVVGDARPEKCTVLAMSGGANNGAWEGGLVWGLANYGNPTDFEWAVSTGVSAGSINTAYFAAWAPSDIVNMANAFSDLMQTMKTTDIWQQWPGGYAQGISLQKGLVNDAPALDFLNGVMATFPEGLKRKWTITAVNVADGVYTEFNQTNTGFDELGHTALSSSSIPGVFPPQYFKGQWFMDGGTVWNVNTASAIQQCLLDGYAESDIVLDAMLCGFDELLPINATSTTLPNYMRKRSWQGYYNGMNALTAEMRSYPKVNWRYLMQQRNGTSGTDELKFDNATTYPLQMSGREQAKDLIACGDACKNFGNLTDFVAKTADMDHGSPLYEMTFTNFLRSNLNLPLF